MEFSTAVFRGVFRPMQMALLLVGAATVCCKEAHKLCNAFAARERERESAFLCFKARSAEIPSHMRR